jgi:hypothetical protein
MRQTMDNDVKRCMEYVRKAAATEGQIARFRQGQGIYIGADGSQVVAQFHNRESCGMRKQTPKAEDIDLDIAITVRNAGHNSLGKLMKLFKLTHHQAQKLRKRILEQANARPEEEAN